MLFLFANMSDFPHAPLLRKQGSKYDFHTYYESEKERQSASQVSTSHWLPFNKHNR